MQDMYQEIHEVAGLERRPVSQSYEMLALAAFESLPMALLAPTDNLRPDAPLIADALRRLDVDYVAAGMEALEALHSAATAAVDAAAAAAAAPLLAALRRQVRAASAALERERANHSSEADLELAAELEERALQRQSMSIRRVLRQPQADEAVGAAAVAESGLPRSSGETDPEYSDDNDVDATWASDQLSEASAESVAVESFIADCPRTLDQTTRVEIGLRDIVSGLASEHLLSLPDANDDRSAGDSLRTPGVHAGSGDAEPMHVSVGVSGASADGSDRRPDSSSMDNTEVKTLHAAGAGQPGSSEQVLQEEQIPQIVASRAAALPPLLDQTARRGAPTLAPLALGGTAHARLPALSPATLLATPAARRGSMPLPPLPAALTSPPTRPQVLFPAVLGGDADRPSTVEQMPGGLPGAETATSELVPPDGSLASGEVARSLEEAGGTTDERGNAGRPGPSHAEGGVALPQKTLLDVCLAARAHTPLQQQLAIIESFVAGIEEELEDGDLAGHFDDDSTDGAEIEDLTAHDTDCATWPAFVRTLSHLLPQTPHGHAAHRAVAARLHSSLTGITSDDRIAGLVLQAVLPRGGGGGYGGSAAASGMWSAALAGAAGRGSDAAAGRSYARMHASARRLVSCIRSAYPGVEEIEPFTGVLTAAPRAARAGTQEAPSKLRWLRPLQRPADGVGAVEPYDGGVLGPADARTAARDVLTRTLTRRRKAAPDGAHAQPSRFATLVSRVAPAPLPCIPEDDPGAARQSHGSEDLGEEELLQREVRRAGAQRLLGLADGRLGPAEEARQQLEARGPLAAMLPVLQAMLARCLSAQDLGFEAGEAGGDKGTFQAEADAALAEAVDAVCSEEGDTRRAAIERHLQRLPQLRQHLLASAAMALLADAVDAADPDLTSGVPQLQHVASLPRSERAVLSEWFRAQRCAAEMLSLACGHLCIMRTSLLDTHLRPGSSSGGGSCSGAGHEASVAADSTDGGSVLGEHAASAGPPV